MTVEEVVESINSRFPDCVVKSVVPFKNGYVVNVVGKRFLKDPSKEIADPLFVDQSGKIITFNPITMDVSGYEKALLGIIYV